jgi:hypothetical protein
MSSGDVVKPGAYDIGSLSTPLNALFAAGGPTGRGSLRIVKLAFEIDTSWFGQGGLQIEHADSAEIDQPIAGPDAFSEVDRHRRRYQFANRDLSLRLRSDDHHNLYADRTC